MDNTCRNLVSTVIGMLRAQNVDDHISSRLVLSTLKNKAKLFIKQDTDSRRLLTISEIWKKLPCIPLQEVAYTDCAFDIPCNKIMKSCFAIPEVFQTSYGSMLKVFTINGERELKQTTLSGYKEIKRREHIDPNVVYYLLIEGFIYVPDSDIDELMGFGLFKNPHEVTRIVEDATCLKPLDEAFPCPDYLLDAVIKDTQVDLLKMFKPIVVDEKPNLNNNEK